MFRSQILPAVIAVWGAAIVINALATGTNGSGAYAAGQAAAPIFGIVMVVLGVRALLKARVS
jgi:hypothetical protein